MSSYPWIGDLWLPEESVQIDPNDMDYMIKKVEETMAFWMCDYRYLSNDIIFSQYIDRLGKAAARLHFETWDVKYFVIHELAEFHIITGYHELITDFLEDCPYALTIRAVPRPLDPSKTYVMMWKKFNYKEDEHYKEDKEERDDELRCEMWLDRWKLDRQKVVCKMIMSPIATCRNYSFKFCLLLFLAYDFPRIQDKQALSAQ